MKNHRCDRTDTGVCPYKKGMEIRQVGANPRVRPVFPFVGSMKNPKIKTFRRLYTCEMRNLFLKVICALTFGRPTRYFNP